MSSILVFMKVLPKNFKYWHGHCNINRCSLKKKEVNRKKKKEKEG